MTCARTATGNATVNSGGAVVDGVYHNGGWSGGSPSPQDPAWVAVRVTGAPSRVLFIWDDGGTYKYRTPTTALVYGFPAAYHIDVSSDSTDGCDGTWGPVATVDDNAFRTRAHSFDFTGKTWVKMVMTQQPVNQSPNNIQIGEIDVHDISATGAALPDDTWFFMGDSITALGHDRAPAHQPSFAALIHTASSAYMPALINGGIGGETSADGLARLSEMLALNPDFRYFALGYGTNDAVGNQVSTSAFRSNMQGIITQLKNAGRVPILARIPYSGDGGHDTVPDFNQVIDSLASTNGLRSGPDLYAWFMTHTDQFVSDKLHPNDVGLAAINQLWATTMRPLYP